MSKAPFQGRCLCGDIQYEADQMSPKMGHCHCTMCRKFHGAAFATFGAAPAAAFRWLQGQELLSTFVADNGTKRKFCSQCGSSMTFESADTSEDDNDHHNHYIEVALGTLDKAPTLSPDAHIYISSKVDWVDINGDDLPKFPNGRT